MFNRSLYILSGLVMAALYGIGATLWFGPNELAGRPMVESIFWALATSGIVMLILHDLFVWLRKLPLRSRRFTQNQAQKKAS